MPGNLKLFPTFGPQSYVMAGVQGIPAVDLADFTSGDPARKQAFVEQLGKAYETIGFVAVRNHAIDPELQENLYRVVQEFFALPVERKRTYEIPELAGQRGYVSFGREHAKDSKAADLKEFWHFGQEVEGDDPIAAIYPDNVQVPEIEGMHATGMQAYRKLEDTGRSMLQAIALYLGLDEFYFDSKMHHGNSILRPIHYPPIQSEPDSAVRAGQHEDINLITLLIGASADGLQVLNHDNEWVSVTALPDHIVVNVGDMLQRLTNNKLKSTTHRVINPPREMWHTSRYSMPFFLHPRSDMRLDCLKGCIAAGESAAYEPITAGEYLDQRLREIGLKA